MFPVRIVISSPSRIPVYLNAYRMNETRQKTKKCVDFGAVQRRNSTNKPIARYTSAISRSTCQSVRSVGSRYTHTGTATVRAVTDLPQQRIPYLRPDARSHRSAAPATPVRTVGTSFTDGKNVPCPHTGPIRRRIRWHHVRAQSPRRLRPSGAVSGWGIVVLLHQVRNRKSQGGQSKNRQDNRQ